MAVSFLRVREEMLQYNPVRRKHSGIANMAKIQLSCYSNITIKRSSADIDASNKVRCNLLHDIQSYRFASILEMPMIDSGESKRRFNMATKQPSSQTDVTARNKQISSSKQSTNLLSQPSDDPSGDGRFSVAEEVNLDQQSDKARHVGQMSFDWGQVQDTEAAPADAVPDSQQKSRKAKREDKLKQSINRAVPPSQ
jgi:hypothetical protein